MNSCDMLADKCVQSDNNDVQYSDDENYHKEQGDVDLHKDLIKPEPYDDYNENNEEMKAYKIFKLLKC